MMTGTVCFEQKNYCNAKFDLGDNGDRGSKYVVESALFGIADPICLFTMQLLWGYNDD